MLREPELLVKALEHLERSLSGKVCNRCFLPADTFAYFCMLGSLPAQILTPARVALSCPIINVLTHPSVAGPVFATNALDLQDFPALAESNRFAVVGPPTVSIEAKLLGLDDTAVEGGADPIGVLTVRGPPVTKPLSGEEMESASGYINVRAGENGDDEEGWANLGVKMRIHTNGAFRVVN